MNIVRELRKRKGIQQKELALSIGVSQPTVSDWESNKTDPSGVRLKRLAEYFGVDELVILGIASNEKSLKDETDHIVHQVLEKLNDQQKTPEIRIVSGAMEKMTRAQQEQVVNVVRAMFANQPDLFN